MEKKDMMEPSITVLLIDNDERVQEMLGMYLGKNKIRLVCADNPIDAIETLKRQEIDIIVTEWVLPMMGIIQFLHWLRQEHSDQIHVVLLTAIQQDKIMSSLEDVKIDKLLFKPVKGDQILEVIRSFSNTSS